MLVLNRKPGEPCSMTRNPLPSCFDVWPFCPRASLGNFPYPLSGRKAPLGRDRPPARPAVTVSKPVCFNIDEEINPMKLPSLRAGTATYPPAQLDKCKTLVRSGRVWPISSGSRGFLLSRNHLLDPCLFAFKSLPAEKEDRPVLHLYLIDISRLVLDDCRFFALFIAVSDNDLFSDGEARHKHLPWWSHMKTTKSNWSNGTCEKEMEGW